MCFYFTLDFRIYLEISIVSDYIKTCPSWICCERVQFQMEIRKLKPLLFTFSRQRRIWSFHVVVLQSDALVAVAFVFCVRSLLSALWLVCAGSSRFRWHMISCFSGLESITFSMMVCWVRYALNNDPKTLLGEVFYHISLNNFKIAATRARKCAVTQQQRIWPEILYILIHKLQSKVNLPFLAD